MYHLSVIALDIARERASKPTVIARPSWRTTRSRPDHHRPHRGGPRLRGREPRVRGGRPSSRRRRRRRPPSGLAHAE